MHNARTARGASRGASLPAVVGVLVVAGVLAGILASLSASSSASTFGAAHSSSGHLGVARPVAPSAPALSQAGRGGHGGPIGDADGVLPEGVTPFDRQHPGVANLDPGLLGALRDAATDATRDGVELDINSGWRSRAYQQQLFDQAVSTYGSAARAAQWVAVPGTSAHETGHAVDIGPTAAAAWLSEHGADYGLCRVYSNEPWHFELRLEAIGQGCPTEYADPTRDPRMQR